MNLENTGTSPVGLEILNNVLARLNEEHEHLDKLFGKYPANVKKRKEEIFVMRTAAQQGIESYKTLPRGVCRCCDQEVTLRANGIEPYDMPEEGELVVSRHHYRDGGGVVNLCCGSGFSPRK